MVGKISIWYSPNSPEYLWINTVSFARVPARVRALCEQTVASRALCDGDYDHRNAQIPSELWGELPDAAGLLFCQWPSLISNLYRSVIFDNINYSRDPNNIGKIEHAGGFLCSQTMT